MSQQFSLEKHLADGIDALVRDMLRATVANPRAAAFFAKYALAAKRAEKRRHIMEEIGEHIPSFLIASITGKCNLNCAGCYDRAHAACEARAELTRADWARIFSEAEELGVSAILLAGGEPLLRPDVIEEASRRAALLFPVFTNGTMMTDAAIALFDKSRNLIPIISIEGDEAQTDARRGEGVYKHTARAMGEFLKRGLLFGASITVTNENLHSVTSEAFLANLCTIGCRAAIFVEYVPVERPELALDDAARELLAARISAIRTSGSMIIISFPGDEAESGGCLAAGRGFFHINAYGGAEPCPFSPFSDTSLAAVSVRDALKSPLFTRLRESGALTQQHKGGCTLFGQERFVQSLTASGQNKTFG